jgi:hypothetical protein
MDILADSAKELTLLDSPSNNLEPLRPKRVEIESWIKERLCKLAGETIGRF